MSAESAHFPYEPLSVLRQPQLLQEDRARETRGPLWHQVLEARDRFVNQRLGLSLLFLCQVAAHDF
ncbi:MAG: hypothetical protein HOW73_50230 [Polyangiaceae bacterium]|nr:hypothetical protein [Polyangiaceae bacterium]